ncbi:MAG: hypothetical protein OIF35_08900 [Cellvibrionaceae bacterium]|nr:hypothetical protein [Cellvibrionaceae bacterium]MCV6627891.1 hypothetical protein [Cellvibrionaceae bacterium]
MSNIQERKQELQGQITELETSLAELRGKLEAVEEAEQHAMIDQLEEYIDVVNHKSAGLKAFWQVVKKELGDVLGSKG